jgi:hypothetical protein
MLRLALSPCGDSEIERLWLAPPRAFVEACAAFQESDHGRAIGRLLFSVSFARPKSFPQG